MVRWRVVYLPAPLRAKERVVRQQRSVRFAVTRPAWKRLWPLAPSSDLPRPKTRDRVRSVCAHGAVIDHSHAAVSARAPATRGVRQQPFTYTARGFLLDARTQAPSPSGSTHARAHKRSEHGQAMAIGNHSRAAVTARAAAKDGSGARAFLAASASAPELEQARRRARVGTRTRTR